jgi:hypothetical protein
MLSDLLAADLPLLPRLLQLTVALRLDLLLTAGEYILRRDVANGSVQADIVVMSHVALHQPHLQATAAFPAGCTLLLAIFANVQFFRSIGDSKAKF